MQRQAQYGVKPAGNHGSTMRKGLVCTQVCKRLGHKEGAGPPLQLRSAWVRRAVLRLPVLALAIDDALLACAERAAALLVPAGATSSGDSSHPDICTPAQEPSVSRLSPAEGAGTEGAPQAAGERALAGLAGAVQRVPPADGAAALAAEARAAAGLRLLIEELSLGPLQLLVDVHVAGTRSTRMPLAVDTSRRAAPPFHHCCSTTLWPPGKPLDILRTG